MSKFFMNMRWPMIKVSMFKKKGFTSRTWRLRHIKDILTDGFFQYSLMLIPLHWKAANILNHLMIHHFLMKRYSICRYLILSAAPAARNLRLWWWAAANHAVLNVRAATCRSRCRSLPTVQVVILHHPGVQAVAQAVPAVPAQAALPAIEKAVNN